MVMATISSLAQSLAHERGTGVATPELFQQAFEKDAKAVASGMRRLSDISTRNNLHYKVYSRAKRNPNSELSKDAPSLQEVYKQAANHTYPDVSIGTELWTKAYATLKSKSRKETVALFLQSLAHVSVYTPPSLATHLLRESPQHAAEYVLYYDKVKASVDSITKALRTMREQLVHVLIDYGDLAFEGDLQDLCFGSAHSLLLLNLCPEPSIHKAAQNLLRQAFPNVESRADCFRNLFLINTAGSMRGLQEYLQAFFDATNQLIEANELAKWMVRSFADILNVLCGSTDGLLRAGTPWSLIEEKGKRQSIASKLPAIWQLMCQCVGAIFDRTPSWSTLLAREDMVAWFRDVTIFASEMVDALDTFRQVVRAADKETNALLHRVMEESNDEGPQFPKEDAMVEALALPIEQATSWLKLNDEEILRETLSFLTKALDQFKDQVDFPLQAKDKMLKFINTQMAIQDAKTRATLMSTEDLADLKMRIDPSAGVIEITDSSEDEVKEVGPISVMIPKHKEAVRTSSSKPANENAHWWAGVGLFGSSLSSSQEKKKSKLRQQKLNFAKVNPSQVIDVDALESMPKPSTPSFSFDFTSSYKAKPSAAPPAPPKALSAPINAYKGSSARAAAPLARVSSSSSSSRPAPKTTGKMAQARQDLAPARSWKPNNVNAKSSNSYRQDKDDEPARGAMASSSVTGAMIARTLPAPSAAAKGKKAESSGSSSSSDSSEDETAPTGLAALRKTNEPIKPPPKRQLKVLEDPVISKARFERQEAERKRKLRSPPDYAALHRSILAWDYNHHGERPPAPTGKEPLYRSVPPLLKDANDYGRVFGPLLLLECWAQLQQAKEEANRSETFPIEIAGRSTVDQFVELNATIAPNTMPPTSYLNETDVVRLQERVLAPGKQPKLALAKVEAFKRHPQGHQVTLRCCLIDDKQGINSMLVSRSKWSMTKLFSLTTLHREFVALMTAAYYDLFPSVLKASVTRKPTLNPEEVRKAMQGYAVNEPQAKAILGSLSTDGFSLIQGPPGTGKTKTICALIGAFVSRRKGPTTSVLAGRSAGVVGAVKKILLCAPSNAAIDEVAKRAKAGMRNADGKIIFPRVVRIGREEGMNVSVKDIALDVLIDQKLEGNEKSRDDAPPTDPSALHNEIHNLKRQKEEKQAELSVVRSNPALVTQLEAEIRNLSAKRLAVMSKLDEAKDKAQTAFRQKEADRRKARTEILAGADVICTTLSGAGHEMLNSMPFDFETVVVDEAAQAVELSTIIPLRYGCKQCILVGDPNQLPPTVISQQAERLKYSQSLFVRMFEQSPESVHLLSIQYRMHPDISVFPSTTFYDSKLQDGPNMAQLTKQPWHSYELTKPFKFLNTTAPETPGRAHSLMNREEANIALALYDRLRLDYPYENFNYRIGIVTMYKAQVTELKRTFMSRYGQDIINWIDFNTVDGFQGQEKDIIMLSCVRSANDGRSIGFLSDRRRVNVAITRAKSNLFIIGNAEHLARGDKLWGTLVQTAKDCKALQNVTVGTFAKSGKVAATKDPRQDPRAAGVKREAGPNDRPAPKAKKQEIHGNGANGSAQTSTGPKESQQRGDDKKRKPTVVRDEMPDVVAKKRKMGMENVSYGVPKSSMPIVPGGGAGQGKMRPPIKLGHHNLPQRPPNIGASRPNNLAPPGPPPFRPTAVRPRPRPDPIGHISVGVPAAPHSMQPQQESQPKQGPVKIPKPSDAAMNALFVKKRK